MMFYWCISSCVCAHTVKIPQKRVVRHIKNVLNCEKSYYLCKRYPKTIFLPLKTNTFKDTESRTTRENGPVCFSSLGTYLFFIGTKQEKYGTKQIFKGWKQILCRGFWKLHEQGRREALLGSVTGAIGAREWRKCGAGEALPTEGSGASETYECQGGGQSVCWRCPKRSSKNICGEWKLYLLLFELT